MRKGIMTLLRIELIRLDGGTQSRNWTSVIAEYAGRWATARCSPASWFL